jgi:hypothetical protein
MKCTAISLSPLVAIPHGVEYCCGSINHAETGHANELRLVHGC